LSLTSSTSGATPNAENKGSFTLSSIGFSALDGSSNSVGYTSTSSTGSARSNVVANGSSYSGLSLVDTGFNTHATMLSIVGGTAGANRTINASFIAAPVGSANVILGDVADLSGFGSTPGAATDIFVAELTYDKTAANSQFGTDINLALKWYDPTSLSWKLATDGNFGGTPTFISGAYDPLNDFHLGYYGVDTIDGYVWAVLNHNSGFGVGNQIQPTPEPSRSLLLGAGAAFLLIRRRKSKRHA